MSGPIPTTYNILKEDLVRVKALAHILQKNKTINDMPGMKKSLERIIDMPFYSVAAPSATAATAASAATAATTAPAVTAVPAKPVPCLMCYKDTTNTDELCSVDCKKDHKERCMFCCSKLPATPFVESDNNFCTQNCFDAHIRYGERCRKCTCGACLSKKTAKIYEKGHVHCSKKCQTAWDAYLAKPPPSPVHYSGSPFPFVNGVVVGVRVGTGLWM